MRNEFDKEQNGITLIALVVTIVVLLILAGITIMYVIGDNGIFQKAQNAKDKTDEAIKNEQEYMNQVDNMINEYTNAGENQHPEEVPIEEIKSDWATIEKLAEEIARKDNITSATEKVIIILDNKKYTINVGDIFEVEYEGEAKRVRVLGFKHDDLVDQTVYGGTHEKASISFEFLDFMTGDAYKQMNTSNTNSGGWGNTQMRKDLNGYSNNNAAQSGAIGGLGANLNNKAYIKQVKKKYIAIYNNANSVATCNDYLWLLATSEVVNTGYQAGAYGYAITSEGSQYKYYQGVTETWNSSSTERQKRPTSLDNAGAWWLRSPGYNHSTTFCAVSNNGEAIGNGDAILARGVAPGFCL